MGHILDATTKSLIVKLGGAVTTNQWEFSASWINKSATAVTPGNTHGTTNGASEVTLIAAPAASEQRESKTISVHNLDTVSGTLIIELADGATRQRLLERVVPPGRTVTINGCGEPSEFPAAASAGDMAGPVSSTDNAIARWDGTNGDTLQNSTVVVDDSGNVTGVVAITTTGLGTFASVAFSSWTLIAAKGDLVVGTANDTVGILTAAANYHVLQTNSTEPTGLQWARRRMIWHTEIADSATYASSSSESSAMYTATAIPSAIINEQRKMIHCYAGGKFSSVGTPTFTVRFKFFDGATSQAISATFTVNTPGTSTDRPFKAECWCVVRSTGATGTLQGVHPNQIGTTVGGARGLLTLDLTNDLTISVTTQCSVNSASNTMTFEEFFVAIEN